MAACRQPDLPVDPGYVEDVSPEPADETRSERIVSKGKGKITAEGQPCRHCGTPVVKRVPRQRKVKEGQAYRFAWYLFCPNCKAMYMVEEAKQQIGGESSVMRDESEPMTPLIEDENASRRNEDGEAE
jgi:hypothetical protein